MFGDFEEVKPIAQIIVEHVWNKVLNTDALIVDLRWVILLTVEVKKFTQKSLYILINKTSDKNCSPVQI